MAKRGELARESVKNTIIDAFSATNSFVTVRDKKIYVNVPDGPNGEIIQFAISMTMPKTPIESAGPVGKASNGVTFSEEPTGPVELSPADKEKVSQLMNRLGIN